MKKKLLQALGYLGIAVLIVAIPLAWATVVKDDMDFKGTNTYSGTETHSGEVTFSGGVTNSGQVQFDSGIAMKTTNLVFTTAGQATDDYTNGTGFTITGMANGNIVFVSLTGVTDYTGSKSGYIGDGRSGTTVNLPTITSTMDGWEVTIVKIDSGTSEVVPYAAGLPIGSASAVTPGASGVTDIFNAQGDAITLIADYDSAVSWWVKSVKIH